MDRLVESIENTLGAMLILPDVEFCRNDMMVGPYLFVAVYSADGDVLSGATVTLQQPNIPLESDILDYGFLKDGRYVFAPNSSLFAGRYRLSVEAEGYLPYRETIHLFRDGCGLGSEERTITLVARK